jgi:branched-chain amino acid transport system substrate-binding protein
LRGRSPAVLGSLLGAVVLAVSACGQHERAGKDVKGNTLTIYSSMPLEGPSRASSVAVTNGAEMALVRAGRRLGKFNIRLKRLDDATPQAGKWDPLQAQANARRAAKDDTTIAYIGEFDSGATANSIPILNKAVILQVSPASTGVGLTKREPGANPGEPQNHYPTDERTFGRVIPRDKFQGLGVAIAMKQGGCEKTYVVNDREAYGRGLAKEFAPAAKRQGLTVLGNEGYDAKALSYRSLAARIQRKGADCVFASAIAENNGVRLFKDLAAGVPRARLYGPDGLAASTFVDPRNGGVSASIAGRIRIIRPVLAPEDYPPEGRKFFAAYQKRYGAPDPYAAYGYEAMSLILDSIKRAGSKGNSRQAVIDQFFSTKDRKSVLGRYGIDRDGDTTSQDEGLYRIDSGATRFIRRIKTG